MVTLACDAGKICGGLVIPYTHGCVCASANKESSHGVPRHCRCSVSVVLHENELLPRGCIPYTHTAIVSNAGEAPVASPWLPGQSVDQTGVAFQPRKLFSDDGVPHPYSPIGSCTGKASAIGMPSNTANPSHLAIDPKVLTLGDGVPLTYRRILSCACKALTVRAPTQATDSVCLTYKSGKLSSGGCVPKPHSRVAFHMPVTACTREVLTIGVPCEGTDPIHMTRKLNILLSGFYV